MAVASGHWNQSDTRPTDGRPIRERRLSLLAHFSAPGTNVSNLLLNIRRLNGYSTVTSTISLAREGVDARQIRFGLRFSLQKTCAAKLFNLLNHPLFNAPNLTPTSSSFGLLTSQSNLPKRTQLGLKLVW
jgi:hypothetical protein